MLSDNAPHPDCSTLPGLSWTLRHPEAWPEGFVWDYNNCKGCAMGLAYALNVIRIPCTGAIMDAYRITHEAAFEIFVCLADNNDHAAMSAITPEHVADAIDAYLAT